MTRRIPDGSMILTPNDARMLAQLVGLSELRQRHRIGDSAGYQLLNDIWVTSLSIADSGNLTRQTAATEERDTWTVDQIAKAARLAPRTVRLDCTTGRLPATKPAGAWLIAADEAKTYLATRRAA